LLLEAVEAAQELGLGLRVGDVDVREQLRRVAAVCFLDGNSGLIAGTSGENDGNQGTSRQQGARHEG
jgi:hypothetical protein